MASRKKRTTKRKAKSRSGTKRTMARKKVHGRASPKKTKKTVKARATKTRKTKPQQARKNRQPVVQDTIVGIVDEPLPGVLRVTEIEEVSVTRSDDDEE